MLSINSLINSKPLSQYPHLSERIQCPICCITFQGANRAMISCQNRHTICMKCLEGITQKARKTPDTDILCPICRQRIQLPLESNEEFNDFMKLISTANALYKSYEQQRIQIIQKNAKIFKYSYEVPRKDQQINQLKRKLNAAESMIEILKMENSDLKSRQIKRGMQTDCEEGQKENQMFKTDGKQQKKLSLSAFFDDMTNETHLGLAKRQFNKVQIEYMVMYDMSKLLQVNLNFNNLGNQGLQILLKEPYMPQLKALKLCNNLISELPSMKYVCQLQLLDLSNYFADSKDKANKITQASFNKLFEDKWTKLKTLGIELETDKIWDNELTLNNIIAQWPVINKVEVSQVCTKITKVKCQRTTITLNSKAKRAPHNKIKVSVQTI